MEQEILRGTLEAYWEQGWEGRIEYALTVPEIDHPVFLAHGQHLTIYNDDDSILWSGRLDFIRRPNWEKHRLDAGVFAFEKQRGVTYADWMDWFWRKPPLKAELRIDMPVEKDTPQLWIHPPLLALVHLAGAFALGFFFDLPFPAPAWVALIGFGILLVGFLFAMSALMAMRRADTSPDPFTPTANLATDGPYRISRNPIYLGYVCVVAGLPLAFLNYWGLFLVAVMTDVFYRVIIVKEEEYLERKFGQAYKDYQSRVRRWL